jgi:hypothetical protein
MMERERKYKTSVVLKKKKKKKVENWAHLISARREVPGS